MSMPIEPISRVWPSGGDLTTCCTAMVEFAPGIGIPRLSEVLQSAPASATVYVEIKGAGIERLVAEVIRGSTTRCAVHSFDHAAVEAMRAIAPEIPRGILFEESGFDVVARCLLEATTLYHHPYFLTYGPKEDRDLDLDILLSWFMAGIEGTKIT